MRLRYSAHAREKVRVRRLSESQIRLALDEPDDRFFDVDSNANIAVREFDLAEGRVGLVVVFVLAKDGVRVITVYPVKDVTGEIRRKVNSGRWVSHRGQKGLKVHYDPDVDILYLIIRAGRIVDSKELDDDVRIEYDSKGSIMGIEVANARRNLARPLSAYIAKQLKAAR